MANGLFVSTAVTGGLLVATALVLVRLREWRRDNPPAEADVFDAALAAARDGRTWFAVYVVLVLATLGAVYAFVSGTVTPAMANAAALVLGAAFALTVFGFVAAGTYHAVRARGRASAQAAGASASAVGALVVLLVAAKLVLAGG